MIQPTASFKDNLQLLPSIEGLARIDLVDQTGAVVATIETSQASRFAGGLSTLQQSFGTLDSQAGCLRPRHFCRTYPMPETAPVPIQY